MEYIKKFVIEVLNTINYQGDIEVFCNKLLLLIGADTIESLNKESEGKIDFSEVIKHNVNPPDFEKTLIETFGESLIKTQLINSTESVLSGYLEEIIPSLDKNQLNNLEVVLNKYKTSNLV